MKKENNNELIRFYKMGWNDSLESKTNTNSIHRAFDEPKYQKVYNLGWHDFLTSENILSVDCKFNNQINKRIQKHLSE